MIFLDFDEIKVFLELEKTEADYPIIPIVEKSVIAAIENYIKRKLEYSNYVVKDNGSNNSSLFALRALPISTINSVKIDGAETTYYGLLKYGIDLYVKLGDLEIEIDYNGGYKKITDTAPEFSSIESLNEEIYRALFLQTIYEYQNRDYIGANSVTNEGGTISKPGLKLLDEVKRILDSHKHIINCGI